VSEKPTYEEVVRENDAEEVAPPYQA
jgi:hypothetical protein